MKWLLIAALLNPFNIRVTHGLSNGQAITTLDGNVWECDTIPGDVLVVFNTKGTEQVEDDVVMFSIPGYWK